MARVTWTLGELRGKVGGLVAQRNASGTIVRARVVPINGRSQRQRSNRALWSAITREWTALSPAERAAWQTAASNPTAWQPMDPYPGTAYTGAMCHDACRRQQFGASDGMKVVSWLDSEGIRILSTPRPPWSDNPPTVRTDGQLLTDTGISPLVLSGCFFSSPSEFRVLFRLTAFPDFTPVSFSAGPWYNGTLQEPPARTTIKLYLSSLAQGAIRSPHKRRRFLLCSLGAWPEFETGFVTMSPFLPVHCVLDLAKLPPFVGPFVGWWYWLEAWQVDERGTSFQLGDPLQIQWGLPPSP
jgi:hypothetical protein